MDSDGRRANPTGADAATQTGRQVRGRRALLQTALAAAGGVAAAAALRGDVASADMGTMKYGATNDAIGSTQVLRTLALRARRQAPQVWAC